MKETITKSQFDEALGAYIKYYDENVEASPKLGFVAVTSYNSARGQELRSILEENDIEIVEDPVEPLHDYKLSESGLNRLTELVNQLK
jgi:hypothetical protein